MGISYRLKNDYFWDAEGIVVDEQGTLLAAKLTDLSAPATPTEIGRVKPDNETVHVKSDGTLYTESSIIDDELSATSMHGVTNRTLTLIIDGILKQIPSPVLLVYTDNDETPVTISHQTISYQKTGSETSFLIPTYGAWHVVTPKVSTTIDITENKQYVVDLRTAVSVVVSKYPDKMFYFIGDEFDPTGMELTVTFEDGTSSVITDFTYPRIVESNTLLISTRGVSTTLTINQNSLKRIEIASQPTKITYLPGEAFNTSGMVVNAIYMDNSVKQVEDYTYSPNGALTPENTLIEVSYTDRDVTKTANVPIIMKGLVSIAITTPPDKTFYTSGSLFEPAGMQVMASYADGTSAFVDTYTYTPTTPLTYADTQIVVSYTENGITKTTIQGIDIEKTLSSIEVTTQPNKKSYGHGDTFDTTGMVITATFNDGSQQAISDYTFSPSDALTLSDNVITISYTFGSNTRTDTVIITVSRVLTDIYVSRSADKTDYIYGELFDKTGMEITADYSDGYSKVVYDWTYTPTTPLTHSNTNIFIDYEGQSTYQPITVKKKLMGLNIVTPPLKTKYDDGDNFDPNGMVVKAVYSDSTSRTITGYDITPLSLTVANTYVTISYTEDGVTETVQQPIVCLRISSFATGTDEEIMAMINAAYAGEINLEDYWAVGDSRTLHLNAIADNGIGESHAEQDVSLVILDFNHDETTDGQKALVTVQVKGLVGDGYMHPSIPMPDWNLCLRRSWCNTLFKAALPEVISNHIKSVVKYSASKDRPASDYIGKENIETTDDVFLLSVAEEYRQNSFAYGDWKYYLNDELGTVYQYYKSTSNLPWDTAYTRSRIPSFVSGDSTGFVSTYQIGIAVDSGGLNVKSTIEPAFCL